MSELDIAEKRIPQDGRFKVKISEKTLALAQARGDQALVTNLQNQLDLFKKALAESN